MLVTLMFSDTPGTPGRRQQRPRMFRSILTPAMDALYRVAMMSESMRPLAFMAMYPLPALLWTSISLSILAIRELFSVSGATSRRLYILGPKKPVRALNSSPTSSPISGFTVRKEMSAYCFADEVL